MFRAIAIILALVFSNVSGSQALASPPSAAEESGNLYIILDTSSSMNSNYDSIAAPFDALLEQFYRSSPADTQRIYPSRSILVPFPSESEQSIVIGTAFSEPASQLPVGGNEEDGLAVISELLDRGVANAHILLITDELRTEQQLLNWRDVAVRALQQRVVIHTVVERRDTSISYRNRAQTSTRLAYFVADDMFDKHSVKDAYSPQSLMVLDVSGESESLAATKRNPTKAVAIRSEYSLVALATGGHVWMMEALVEGQTVFVDELSLEIKEIHQHKVLASISVQGEQVPGGIVTLDAHQLTYFIKDIQVDAWSWDFDLDNTPDDFGPVVNYQQQHARETIYLQLLLDNGERVIQPLVLGAPNCK